MSAPFRWELTVRYAECDMQGHVFNAHYLTWVDVAHLELLRAAVGPHAELLAGGADYVVAEVGARYRSPARFDDTVAIEVTLDPLGNTSMTSRHRVLCGDELLVEAWVRHVCVDAETHAKRPWPEHVRAALEPYVVSPPGP